MKFLIAILGAMLISAPAGALEYATANAAALSAAVQLYSCSRYYECAARIAKIGDGKFIISPITSDSASDHVRIPVTHPAGMTIVADIHAHPCLDKTHEVEIFSPTDIMGALMNRHAEYMLSQCTGNVYLFVPGTMSPNDYEIPDSDGLYTSKGVLIGKISVSGFSVEPTP